MRAGKINKRIVIQKTTISAYSSLGERTSTWENLTSTVWASAEFIGGDERFEGGMTERMSKVLMEFHTRWSSAHDITPEMRVLYNSKYYNIKSVENVKEQNRDVKIIGELIA